MLLGQSYLEFISTSNLAEILIFEQRWLLITERFQESLTIIRL